MRKKELLKSIIREFHSRPLPSFVPQDGLIPCVPSIGARLDKLLVLMRPRLRPGTG